MKEINYDIFKQEAYDMANEIGRLLLVEYASSFTEVYEFGKLASALGILYENCLKTLETIALMKERKDENGNSDWN